MKIRSFTTLLILTILALCILIMTPLVSDTGSPDRNKPVNIKSDFAEVEKYIEFIEKNVAFENIDFQVHTVKQGDNFWKIAKKFNVNIDTLIALNPFWESLVARVNQKVVVSSEKGVLCFISDFREVSELKKFYGVTDEDIVFQKLPLLYRLYYGIFTRRHPIAVFIKNARPDPAGMTDKLARQYTLREKFRSPLGGRFSSFFGNRRHPIFRSRSFHNGIDIAARRGTLVGAAREGKVIATGWMGGYGKAVIIAHPEGYKTLYGHLSRINTRPGRQVKAGWIIGRVGSTGFSTGPHLHFTLWHRGKLLNPMKILW